MSASSHPLERAAQALRRAAPAGTEVRLLAEGQLVASRGMVKNPAAGAGKAPAQVPGAGGFELYLALRTRQADDEARGTSQRIGPRAQAAPEPAGQEPPALDGDARRGEWRADDGHGHVVTVHATAGDAAAVDDVNALIRAAWQALLG